MTGLDDVYRQRFPEVSRRQKDLIWPEIARYLERWVDPAAPVLDIACDSGYFIRNVHAVERWAADLRDVRAELPDDVHFVQANGLDLEAHVPVGTFGTVFMSNYLEHLHGPEAVIEQLRGRAAPAPDGRPPHRPPAERPARRRRLLGLHRPPRRPDRAEPGRGRRPGRPARRSS